MVPKPTMEDTPFYGNSLHILREYIPSDIVDLISLEYTVQFRPGLQRSARDEGQ